MSEGTYKGRVGRIIKIQNTHDKRGALLTLKLKGTEELLIYEDEVKVLSIFKKRDKVKVASKGNLHDGMIGKVVKKTKVENGFRYDVEFSNMPGAWCDEDELEGA